TYSVDPTMTFGSARTFFTHCDSPRVDTRYLAPSTSTVMIGMRWGFLVLRAVTVSVSPIPKNFAMGLKTLAVTQFGLRYAMTTQFDCRHATPTMAGPVQPACHQPDPAAVGRLGAHVRHP